MPDFQPHTFNGAVCRDQVQEFKALLDGSSDIGEATFHAFFQPRSHLRALIGPYNPLLTSPDLLAWEYPIFGDFRCDFAIGDSVRKAYTFVEYEDAGPNSLFVKQGEKATRAWSPRLERGYSQRLSHKDCGGTFSTCRIAEKPANRHVENVPPQPYGTVTQIIDWFYKLHVMTDTPDMEARLGKRSVRYTGLLIIGRNQHLLPGERLRLEWRREHVVVNSKHIDCITYDQLLEDLLSRLEQYALAVKASG